MSVLRCGRYELDLKQRPLVMGIVNITPDSFSDGGKYLDHAAAVQHAHRLIEEGADLLDLGAESTRPGAAPLPLDEEWSRLHPVLEALRNIPVPISIDTYKPEVMRAALGLGVSMINDVYGFRMDGAISAVADSDCTLCVMHMQHDPRTMQLAPRYEDVVTEVTTFLGERVETLTRAGIARSRLLLDPGFGFGKTVGQNYELLRRMRALQELGLPLLAGLSRKNMIGAVTGRSQQQRTSASVVAAIEAARRGARVLRVHDVAETVDALKVWRAINDEDHQN